MTSFFEETSTLASVLCVDIDILSVGYRVVLDIELGKLFLTRNLFIALCALG